MLPVSKIPLRIAQVSDIHSRRVAQPAGGGRSTGIARAAAAAIEPDLVVIRGRPHHRGLRVGVRAGGGVGRTKSSFRSSSSPATTTARNVGYIHFHRLFGDPYCNLRASFEPERAERLQATGLHGRRPRLVRARRERGPGRPRPLRVDTRAVRRARRHPDRRRPPPPRPDPGHRPRAEHRPRCRRPAASRSRARRRRRPVRSQARARSSGA